MCGKYRSPTSESGRFLEMGYEQFLLLPPPPPVSCCAPPRLPAPDPPLEVKTCLYNNIDFLNGNDIIFIKFYRTFYNFVWTGYLSAERSELFGIKT